MAKPLISKSVKKQFRRAIKQIVTDLSENLLIIQESSMFVDCPNDIWDSVNGKSSNVFDASFISPIIIFQGTDQERTITPIPFTSGRCPVCFESETLIETPYGFKKIEEFKTGDIINDGDCISQKVNNVFTREDEFEFTYINTWGNSIGIEATKNHPFPVYDNIGSKYSPVLGNIYKKSIDEIKKGDIVCKTIKQLPLESLNSFNFSWKKIINFPKDFSETIEITDEFLFNLGIYIAEGSTSRNRTVSLTLNKIKETDLGHKVCQFWSDFSDANYNVYFKNEINAAYFEIYSASLSDFFDRLCGHGSANKKIPDELYYTLNRQQTLSLLFGLFVGDGYYRKNTGEITLATVSKTLIYQVYNLLLSCGFDPSIHSQEENTGKDGTHRRKSYYLSYYNDVNYKKRGRILTENILYSVVKTVRRRIKTTKVYNLEVDNNHSYIAEGYHVYNCVGEGQLFTNGDICVNALINYFESSSEFQSTPAGKEGVNFLRVKVLACHYDLIARNDIFVVHNNIKCEKFRPPFVRGLGGDDSICEFILQTTEVGELTTGKFDSSDHPFASRTEDPRRRIKSPSDINILRGTVKGQGG